MAGLFDSAWLKWAWAVKHGEALQDDIRAFAPENQVKRFYSASSYYDAKRHCIILTVDSVSSLPLRWGLMLGDVINNTRSTLDHLAWAVVQRGRTPNLTDRQARGVYFPLTTSPAEFKACLPRNLPGVRGADIAMIRRYQPYFQGKRRTEIHVFVPLPKLSGDDKHRTVQPVLILPESHTHKISQPTDCVITRITAPIGRQPLKVGTELQRVYVRKTGPNPQLEMESQIRAYPGLNERTLLEDWLTQAVSFTGRLLREFSEPPDEFFELAVGQLDNRSKMPPKVPPPARRR